MELIVGMGEYLVSDKEGDTLKTFSLASCVAVTAYCPIRKASGMIHVVLPSPLDNGDIAKRPGYFAATGIPLLIRAMCQRYGCQKEELHIRMFGGANSIASRDIYMVGMKNIDAAKCSLLGMGLTIKGADIRGNESRTLEMDVKTGAIKIYRQPI